MMLGNSDLGVHRTARNCYVDHAYAAGENAVETLIVLPLGMANCNVACWFAHSCMLIACFGGEKKTETVSRLCMERMRSTNPPGVPNRTPRQFSAGTQPCAITEECNGVWMSSPKRLTAMVRW